ncbi:cobalamin biosynthesis protein CobD [Clostridium sp. D2Q-14]|uniref:adenosylcobinamide-phosphate synthase CbiB n=1 Tax=Anaeromonas gelatinilytica TaxID=2683194 RepID=UPI00193C3B5C|nr:adenosylcobinamide-phosphate synthase CbiB [Anaeromonas gelatinilytica]MBS4535166.1 cobalamin biosynthesis protein CobD [Anaeromonas gelatinilytica]
MEALLLLSAIILDYILGDPYSFPHPIIYVGKMIGFYEKQIRRNMTNLKLGGFILLILSLVTVVLVIHGILIVAGLISNMIKSVLMVYFIYTLLAAKCLNLEAKKVYDEIIIGNVEKARIKISYLVGRDTSSLSLEEINRATIETVAENTIDGVLAPVFYVFLGFLVGYPLEIMFLYKTVNTLDSMVGYIQEPYKDIGFASAKLDDILNYIPARIGSIFMVIAGGIMGYDIKNGFRILKRDRLNHKSPNCGYPESAIAGLLNIQLGGSNIYFGEQVYKPTLGDKSRTLKAEDILSTIKIMYMSEILLVFFIVIGKFI